MNQIPRVTLPELIRVFLFIGITGFGGGMAIISLTERYCVHQKKWLTIDEFMHAVAFGQILGPFSLNTATFIGCYLRGIAGGITAAVAFMFPSFCLISFLSWLYFRFHELPQLQSALKGTNPVIIALILVAAISMGRSRVKSLTSWAVALLAFSAAAFLKMNAIGILVLAGVWGVGRTYLKREHA